MELKPCPFCESKDVELIPTGIGAPSRWCVQCNDCHTEGPVDLGQSGAIEQWNARPEVDAICNWTPRKDELGYVTWTTTCWETVQDVDLGLGSEFPYCPYCGKKAVWGVIPTAAHDA